MKHLACVSRRPSPAQIGVTTPIETIILLLVTVLFRDWDNFPQVIQNLQKYYAKTPAE
jgi:hypothetical protein